MIRPILPPIITPDKTAMTTQSLLTLGQLIVIIGIAMLAVWLMLKALRKDEIKADTTVCLLLTAGVGLFVFLSFGISLALAKGLILFGILMYASLSDIGKREVPDCVWVMISILAFVDFESVNLASILIGAAVVFIPQLALAMIKPNRAVGGADIKISTASAFLLGAEKGILALIIGLTIAVAVMLILRKLKKADKAEPFPLVPFLSLGMMTAFLI